MSFIPAEIRRDFPLWQQPESQDLVYLDSAATAQKPQAVIDAITQYYMHTNANIHRGVHRLSEQSTSLWETARDVIARFLGADSAELIITRNATEALNGVAYGWAARNLKSGDVILTTLLEHHANTVPWQQIALQTGATVMTIGTTADGRLDEVDWATKTADPRVRLVAVTHVSNVTGAELDLRRLIKELKKQRSTVRVVVDAAQSVPHLPVSFHDLGADFLAFSGHKLYGPMGVGGLLVKAALLESGEFQPWLFGGGMIESVTPTTATFQSDSADRFTAGTPDVASIVGLAAAMTYLDQLGGMTAVAEHEAVLVKMAYQQLAALPEIELIGPDPIQYSRVGSVAFVYRGVHAHDVAQVMESQHIAIRSGHHCAMPLHTARGWSATNRLSFGIYSTQQDIERVIAALAVVKKLLAHV